MLQMTLVSKDLEASKANWKDKKRELRRVSILYLMNMSYW